MPPCPSPLYRQRTGPHRESAHTDAAQNPSASESPGCNPSTHLYTLQERGLQSQSGLNGADAMAIVPDPAKPRPRPDDELCAGWLLTSRVSSETQSTWVTMPHQWHHPPSILRAWRRRIAVVCHRRLPLAQEGDRPLPVCIPSRYHSTVPIFGAHRRPLKPAVALPLPSMIIELAMSRACPCSAGLSLTLPSLPGWLASLFQVPVRRARWGLPNIPTPSSEPLLDSTRNVKVRLCQCFPAICSIHFALVSHASDPASPLCRDCRLTLPVRSCVILVSLSLLSYSLLYCINHNGKRRD